MSGVRGSDQGVFTCICGAEFLGNVNKIRSLKRMHLKVCKLGKEMPSIQEDISSQRKISNSTNINKQFEERFNKTSAYGIGKDLPFV